MKGHSTDGDKGMGDAAPTSNADKSTEENGRSTIADRVWRFIGIVGFAVVSGVVLSLAWAVALLQYVHLLVRGDTNRELAGFMDVLTAYLGQILDYLAGRGKTDDMPFPFSAFPDTSAKDGNDG